MVIDKFKVIRRAILKRPFKRADPACTSIRFHNTGFFIIRKILATCLCRRTNKRIDKEIPIEQAAYRTGRSTTEHVLATKLVIERTLTSENEEVHLLLLDMSKAFDTMERKTLINDLELILEPDEIFLFCKLLDIKLAVKCGSTLGNLFETDTGGPQGDCSSAKNFTFYLAKTLKPDQTESQNQTAQDQQGITLEQQYADDISKITTNRQEIEKTLEEYPIKLENRGLIINEDKTELYTISKTSDESWKKCKLLGTYLDTKEDIKRRKSLAIKSAKNLKPLFNNKKYGQPLNQELSTPISPQYFCITPAHGHSQQLKKNNWMHFREKCLK